VSSFNNPKVKVSDDKNVIILNNKGEPEVFVYFNPFTNLWTSMSKYIAPVLNPEEDLEKYLDDILKYLDDTKEFWTITT
jgi:hypothetical protein